VQESLARWSLHITRLIEKGQQTGEIRPAAEPGRYATLFIALVEGGILLAKATNNPAALEISLSHIEHLIENELVA
jgi:TetR/AcrR family transcriptional repressor of nem operon